MNEEMEVRTRRSKDVDFSHWIGMRCIEMKYHEKQQVVQVGFRMRLLGVSGGDKGFRAITGGRVPYIGRTAEGEPRNFVFQNKRRLTKKKQQGD